MRQPYDDQRDGRSDRNCLDCVSNEVHSLGANLKERVQILVPFVGGLQAIEGFYAIGHALKRVGCFYNGSIMTQSGVRSVDPRDGTELCRVGQVNLFTRRRHPLGPHRHQDYPRVSTRQYPSSTRKWWSRHAWFAVQYMRDTKRLRGVFCGVERCRAGSRI